MVVVLHTASVSPVARPYPIYANAICSVAVADVRHATDVDHTYSATSAAAGNAYTSSIVDAV